MESKIDYTPIIIIGGLGIAAYVLYKKFFNNTSSSENKLSVTEITRLRDSSSNLYTEITGKTGGNAYISSDGTIATVGAPSGTVQEYLQRTLREMNLEIVPKRQEYPRVANTGSTFKNIYGENATTRIEPTNVESKYLTSSGLIKSGTPAIYF